MNRFNILGIFLISLIMVACTDQKSDNKKSEGYMADKAEVQKSVPVSFQDIPFHTIDGQPTSLAAYSGKVVLIVNVASACGYTRQYADLEQLYRFYGDSGLVVIGFPANNFGAQEPGTNEEILKFCQTKFDVTFPIMAKVSVLGDDKHSLFVGLTEKSEVRGDIKWNFSKFLLDRNGNLVSRYESKIEPMSDQLQADIKNLF